MSLYIIIVQPDMPSKKRILVKNFVAPPPFTRKMCESYCVRKLCRA